MCPLGMATSVVSVGEQKREIASQLVLSSRARRGDLSFHPPRLKREIASQARNDKITPSSRAQRGDLGCSGLDKQTKERLLRRLAMTKSLRHREEHSDLGCSCW